MTAIRLVSAFGLLLVTSTAAQAGSPVAATSVVAAPAAVESALPKLDLGLGGVDYAPKAGQLPMTARTVGAEARAGAQSPSLAHYLRGPSPYGQLLPQAIDERGLGYRVWF